ncbi:cytochrome P450 [Cristinia sonorae]|uniref:Cytochrome P450 n=1 Tax=Cristinia sonorae TaxID=1940300 RepID=A0A8K0URQ1_9AGAR|nr:cytochrome P450 [Cristinia sonorae]
MNLVYTGLAVLFTYLVFRECRGYLRRRSLPPGPRGLPLIGNVHQLPTKLPWIRFFEISKQFDSPVISFNAAGQTVIVLNDHKSAFELLDRRSLNYSHRPRFIMAGELLCAGIMLSFISYGDLFRRMRRFTHQVFGPHNAEQFCDMQEKEAGHLVLEILQRPKDWDNSLKRSTSSNILTATYGWPRLDDTYLPLVKRIHDHTEHLSNACIPGTSMVDLFPFINHLPLWMSKWKKKALAWHERESRMFEGFVEDVKVSMAKGHAPNSFTSALIENSEKHGLSNKEGAWLAGIMFSAGAETTSATLENFLIAMIHHPHIMRKAQAEIDRVVGRGRLPTFKDRSQLPYIRALVREILRWRPAGPMGIPRRVSEDDYYEGYYIPKGAIVISNIWAIDRDPALYANPEDFIPERHLDETETVDVSPPDMHGLGHSSFGFGRRTCVGVTFASQSLFINIAHFLWAFNVEAALDANGEKRPPSLTDVIDAGVTVGPAPFDCRITPRSSDVLTVVERSVFQA